MRFKLAGIEDDSIVDGPGFRLTVFCQGCPHRCPGCHNPEAHDPEGGAWAETGDILERVRKNGLLDGVALSGGEPFEQPEAMAEIAEGIRAMGLTVVTYTGYTLGQLEAAQNPAWDRLLQLTDILVDGPFVLGQRSLALPYRGSANQRVLDMDKTRREGTPVEYAPEVY